MNRFLLIPALLIFCFSLSAQSYEGIMGEGMMIWVDLSISANNGIAGSYFYKKHGGEIKLSGTKNGKNIILSEKNEKQKVTGTFTLSDFGDSLSGKWEKPGSTTSLKVKLFKTDSAYKKYAVIPSAAMLILTDGKTLDDALAEYSGDGYTDSDGNPTTKKPILDILYAQKNILSTGFNWSFMGAYPSDGSIYYTFDLKTKKEIPLWDQVTADFVKYLKPKIQAQLLEARKAYSDSEWEDVFSSYYSDDEKNSNKTLDEHFTVSDITKWNVYYLDGYSLHFVIDGYFSFPHAMMAMDMSCDIAIPYKELKKYLKIESVFQKL